MPALYITPTPYPPVPNPETMTDIQLATLLQTQDKAIAACNADKNAIAKMVQIVQ